MPARQRTAARPARRLQPPCTYSLCTAVGSGRAAVRALLLNTGTKLPEAGSPAHAASQDHVAAMQDARLLVDRIHLHPAPGDEHRRRKATPATAASAIAIRSRRSGSLRGRAAITATASVAKEISSPRANRSSATRLRRRMRTTTEPGPAALRRRPVPGPCAAPQGCDHRADAEHDRLVVGLANTPPSAGARCGNGLSGLSAEAPTGRSRAAGFPPQTRRAVSATDGAVARHGACGEEHRERRKQARPKYRLPLRDDQRVGASTPATAEVARLLRFSAGCTGKRLQQRQHDDPAGDGEGQRVPHGTPSPTNRQAAQAISGAGHCTIASSKPESLRSAANWRNQHQVARSAEEEDAIARIP